MHDLVITPEGVKAGETSGTAGVRGLVLYSLAEDDVTGLERAHTMKAGWLSSSHTEPDDVNISRRVAMNAKRAMQTDWQFKVASGTSVNRAIT